MEIEEIPLGTAIHNIFLYNHVAGYNSQNEPILATVTNGNPAVLYIFNMNTLQMICSFQLKDAQGAMVLSITKEGKVVAGTFDNGGLYIVDPVKKRMDMETLSIVADSFMYSLIDDENYIYGGGFPNSTLWRMSKKTREIEKVVSVSDTQKYLRSIVKEEESFYLGVGTQPHLYHYDSETRKKTRIIISEEFEETAGSITRLSNSRNFIIGLIDKLKIVFFYSKIEKKSYIFKNYNDFLLNGNRVWLFNKNKLDYVSLGDMDVMDVKHAAENFSESYRKVMLLTINNKDCFVSVTMSGKVLIYDIKARKMHEETLAIKGEQTIIQSIKVTKEGSVYMGGYQSGGLSIMLPDQSKIKEYKGIEQIEGMTILDNKVYLGVYPGGHLYRFNQEEEQHENVSPQYLFTIGSQQDRPFAMTNNGKKLFIGTVPASGSKGGALTVYTPESENVISFKNIIKNHSIISLTYHNNFLFGGTSVWGGMGASPLQEDAHFFVWNIEEEKLENFFVPLKGEKAITDLAFDYEGYLWGLTRSKLFKMDKLGNNVIEEFEVRPSDWNVDHMWREGKILPLKNNNLILKVYNDIYLFIPLTGEFTKIIEGVDLIELYNDTLYFSRGRNLYKAII